MMRGTTKCVVAFDFFCCGRPLCLQCQPGRMRNRLLAKSGPIRSTPAGVVCARFCHTLASFGPNSATPIELRRNSKTRPNQCQIARARLNIAVNVGTIAQVLMGRRCPGYVPGIHVYCMYPNRRRFALCFRCFAIFQVVAAPWHCN